MATFKSKVVSSLANPPGEVVYENGRHICTITGKLTTEDPKIIADLTRLGYKRLDTSDSVAGEDAPGTSGDIPAGQGKPGSTTPAGNKIVK